MTRKTVSTAISATKICTTTILSIALMLLSMLLLALPSSAYAARNAMEGFQVDTVLGDGKQGRVWRQWRKKIQERAVEKIVVRLQKRTGGSDTFVNLRYGNSRTFGNGRQVFLKNNNSQSVTWNVGREKPNGRELVLNAYKGEVYVARVTIHYVADIAPPILKPPFIPPAIPAPPGTIIPPRPTNPSRPNGPSRPPFGKPYSPDNGNNGYENDFCDNTRIQRPRVEFFRARPSGGLFSGKYRIEGEIFAKCVVEVGYFERGKKKKEINFPLRNSSFKRRDFEIRVRSGRRGVIRVYTADGRRYSYDVDEAISNNSQSQGLNF